MDCARTLGKWQGSGQSERGQGNQQNTWYTLYCPRVRTITMYQSLLMISVLWVWYSSSGTERVGCSRDNGFKRKAAWDKSQKGLPARISSAICWLPCMMDLMPQPMRRSLSEFKIVSSRDGSLTPAVAGFAPSFSVVTSESPSEEIFNLVFIYVLWYNWISYQRQRRGNLNYVAEENSWIYLVTLFNN